MVTAWPIRMMIKDPANPTDPTENPNRRNMMAPNMVDMAVRKTGVVPKLDLVVCNCSFIGIKSCGLNWDLDLIEM